jgi:hypothetical protein
MWSAYLLLFHSSRVSPHTGHNQVIREKYVDYKEIISNYNASVNLKI